MIENNHLTKLNQSDPESCNDEDQGNPNVEDHEHQAIYHFRKAKRWNPELGKLKTSQRRANSLLDSNSFSISISRCDIDEDLNV